MLRFSRFALGVLSIASTAFASDWTVSTIAGTGTAGHHGDGGPALAAEITDPYGVVRGPDEAIWFCEHNGHRIRRIAPDGTISTIAGIGEPGYSGDGGPATKARLNLPHELRFGPSGDLYVADTGNHAVRRIDLRTGVISTFVGNGKKPSKENNGSSSAESLDSPHSIQFDSGNLLYVCEVPRHVIRVVRLDDRSLATFAGTGKPGPTPDDASIAGTPLNNPRSIDVDRDNNLWLVTREGNQVFKFDLHTRRIRWIAGNGASGFTGNGGPAREATLSGPKGISVDTAGNVWLADTESHSIRMIEAATNKILLVAGTGEKGRGRDGDALDCALNRPHGIFADRDGSVLIGDSESNVIRVLHRRGSPP